MSVLEFLDNLCKMVIFWFCIVLFTLGFLTDYCYPMDDNEYYNEEVDPEKSNSSFSLI